jgi:hypothetical protein
LSSASSPSFPIAIFAMSRARPVLSVGAADSGRGWLLA